MSVAVDRLGQLEIIFQQLIMLRIYQPTKEHIDNTVGATCWAGYVHTSGAL